MKLTTVSRILCAGATLGILSTLGVSAATIRHVGPMAHSYKIVFGGALGGARPDFTCPPTYFACVTPTRSSPYTAEWCISTTGNCTSGLVGNWSWTSVVNKIGDGFSYKRVHATWSPNPGNPSTLTISDKRRKAKGTKLIASVTNTTCDTSTGSCFSNFSIYGVTN